LAGGTIVTTNSHVEPTCSGFAGRTGGVTSLVCGAGIYAESVFLDAGSEGVGYTDIACDSTAAALGTKGQTEFAGQRLAGRLLGFTCSAFGPAHAAIGTLIDTDPVDDTTPRRFASTAGFVTGLARRAAIVTKATTGWVTRRRLGRTGSTVFAAASAVRTSVTADPLLLVAGHLDTGCTVLIAGGAQGAVVFADIVHDSAWIDAFGTLEIADLILGAQGNALSGRVASTIVLDTFITLIVAEITLGAFVDALTIGRGRAQHRLQLA